MKYKNVNVLEINPVIYLGEEFKNNYFKENQNIFKNKIKQLRFNHNFWYENPIDDMISMYVEYDDDFIPLAKESTIDRIFGVVNELLKVFTEVKINLHLVDFIEGEGNSIDLNIKDFTEYLLEELNKYESKMKVKLIRNL
jgi:hypothetical protein